MTAPEDERDHRKIGTEGVDDNTRRALENKRAPEPATEEHRANEQFQPHQQPVPAADEVAQREGDGRTNVAINEPGDRDPRSRPAG